MRVGGQNDLGHWRPGTEPHERRDQDRADHDARAADGVPRHRVNRIGRKVRMNFSVGVFDLATYAIPVDTRAF